jgi:Tol biopolymer transport system component
MKASFFFIFLIAYHLTCHAQPRPMTTDDGLDIVNLSSAIIAPTGSRVIYAKSELNWEKNKRNTKYHIVNADGTTDYPFIGEDESSNLQFSPDGTYVSLLRKGETFRQIFLMRANGGEAIRMTSHTTDVASYKWSKDSKKIFFLSSETESKEEKKEKKDGYDHVVIDEGPNGQQEGSWNYLYVYDLESDSITQLTSKEQLIGSWDVSPDGKKIAYTSRTENRRNQEYLSEIYLFNIDDSTSINQSLE